MRCFTCNKLSLEAICKECQKEYLKPNITKKEIGNLEVVSFFDYDEIIEIARSKYSQAGRRVYKFLAKRYFKPFIEEYVNNLDIDKIYLIAVDENVTRGYSNVAILTEFSSNNKNIKALHGKLKALNRVKYAGKSLEFRLNNKRDFVYKGPKDIDAILIDDIITTGTTIQEAYLVLKENGVNIHFALTLASVKEGIDD